MAFDKLDFKWTAEVFGTKESKMDTEHAGLFAAIDKVEAEKTAASFEALAGLVIQHFKDEEAIMTAAGGVPAAHKKAHDDLLAVATAKLGELKSGKASVDAGLISFLQNWLKNHIKGSDIPSYGK